ncbi:MAG: hypothetical protein GXO83_10670 [Chlorobi bacterium]|nr:hypothetical protein [Chlorobiota bacterium]
MNQSASRISVIFTAILLITLSVISVLGVFIPETYSRETASLAAQGMGQDFINLFIVVPLLFIILLIKPYNRIMPGFIYGGLLLYILYSFFIYSFGIHFNRLFILYCLTLGLSFYAFVFHLHEFSPKVSEKTFGPKIPAKITAIFFMFIALVFYMLWLKDIIPALIHNTVPEQVHKDNLLVNPVHVVDLAFALPALIITAILLFKKHRIGYLFAPVWLGFCILLGLALTGMVVALKIKGISEDLSVAFVFVTISLVSLVLLWGWLKNIKQENHILS